VNSSEHKIRILIITHHLDKGGLEEVVLMYAKFLDKQRFEVAVAYRVHGVVAEEIRKLQSVQIFHYEAATKWKRFQLLRSFAKRFHPDIIHNHFNWIGLLVGRSISVPCVETIHNTYHFLTTGQRIAFSLLSVFASRIIAVSDHVREFTIKYFPFIAARKIVVIHNGVDVARIQMSHEREESRRSLGIASSEFVIGFVGRLEKQKGLQYLLEAMKELNESFTHLKIIIAGDGTLRKNLEEQARTAALNNIVFLGYQRDTTKLYAAFDVFVLPSLFEGLPVSAIEAMAASCPVVATRVGGVVEVVDHEVTGLLVDPGKPAQLADALRRLLTKPDLCKQMGAKGRVRAKQEFSAEMMIAKTERVYNELLGSSHSSTLKEGPR
jgi:glycosyltransferase involved in cell wall biosynthesis